MTIVHEPNTEAWHPCDPGWKWHEQTDASDVFDLPSGWYWHMADVRVPAGRVVECDTCGTTWVCERVPEKVGRHIVVCAHNEWRRETRRERKRRERHA